LDGNAPAVLIALLWLERTASFARALAYSCKLFLDVYTTNGELLQFRCNSGEVLCQKKTEDSPVASSAAR